MMGRDQDDHLLVDEQPSFEILLQQLPFLDPPDGHDPEVQLSSGDLGGDLANTGGTGQDLDVDLASGLPPAELGDRGWQPCLRGSEDRPHPEAIATVLQERLQTSLHALRTSQEILGEGEEIAPGWG